MVPVNQGTDRASLNGDGPEVQLPAYSETDEQSDAGADMVDRSHSPILSTHMTAEQEKANLAFRDRVAGPPEEAGEQYHTTSPTYSDIYEPPRGNDISAPVLFQGLQVPSSRSIVSSGFPYPDMLKAYDVSPREWSTFTSEITKAAQMSSKDWTLTVGASTATFVASGVFLGWLGLIPAVFVGHHLRRVTEHKNLQTAKDSGDLESKLLRWNQTTFAPRGFLVRLDLPGEQSDDLERMQVYSSKKWRGKCGGARKARAGTCCTRGRWANKAEKKAECSKQKTAKRGRIVIVPLQGRSYTTTTMQVPQEAEIVGQNPASTAEKGLHAHFTREI